MRTESKKLLFDVATACRAIQAFNAEGSIESYSADDLRRAGTERKFEIIGEAMVRLKAMDPPTFARFSDAHAIIGFRNRLIHGYDLVDHEIVWRVIQDRVPQLLQAAEALLQEPDSPER